MQEEDINKDGINDILNVTFQIAIPEGKEIDGITLLLFFDYKLTVSYLTIYFLFKCVFLKRYI